MSDKPEINVKRRRKGEKPVKQASAPVRRETPRPSSTGSTGGGTYIPSGGGTVGSGGSNIFRTNTGKGIGCGGILLIIAVVILSSIFSNGGEVDQTSYEPQAYEPQVSVPTSAPIIAATRTPFPTRAPSAAGSGDTWLVMLYQDADDQTLEQDIFLDLNEVERIGSTDKVTIVTQMDRFRGGYQGVDDWRTTRRYLVTQDNDLNRIGSQLIEDLGETNMADGRTLAEFVVWAMRTYPADKYALILSDHGMGWPGGWSDPDPGGRDGGSAPIIKMLKEDSIYLAEMDEAFALVQANTGIEKLDLIGMDACLMSQMEVYSMLHKYARYAVASEETEPGLGWAYTGFLGQLVANPSMDGASLAASIVETYISEDQRIVDDRARAEFLNQGRSVGSFFSASSVSAAQLSDQLERNVTLTAVDLEAYPALVESFNAFTYALQSVDQRLVASARNYAQSYTSIFGNQVPPSYIDFGHFVQLIARNTQSTEINAAARDFLTDLSKVIVAEKHGRSKPGSTGIAIYFPNSTLYRSPYTGMKSYTDLAETFARTSLWDDFLVFHYNDRSFSSSDDEPVVPSTSGITRAPGAGNISISSIEASANSVSPGQAVKLSADISGDNIGYVYLFTGFYESQSNSIYVADTDYIESPDTAELNGVYYPFWPEAEEFRMNFDWEPLLFNISDGTQSSLALFAPVSYGENDEETIYSVDGTYTFAATGEQRTAQLYFKDGRLFQVFGFKGTETAAAPAEITPLDGDSFTIRQKRMDLDSSGLVSEITYLDGDTLTFSSDPFVWEQVYAPDGDYVVGFLVSDHDGGMTEAYTQITVR